MINIDTYCLGMWMTNSYVISIEGSSKCWIIDAGFEPRGMIDEIKAKGLLPEMLIFTHAHLDHIAGEKALRSEFPGLKTAIFESEAGFLTDPELNLSTSAGMMVKAEPADMLLADEQTIEFEGHPFRVIHTPGHSPGGICLYQKENNILFSGDTLFQGSVGRYDFPTSDGQALMRSIKEKLANLPEDTDVYPGHGAATRIGDELRTNPFL